MTGSELLRGRRIVRLVGGIFVVSIAYVLGQLLGGSVAGAIGFEPPPVDDPVGAFGSLLAAAVLISLTITVASRVFTGSRLWHLLTWFALVFFGTVGIILEGMVFFPGALPPETIPNVLIAQIVAAFVTATAAAVVLGPTGDPQPISTLTVPYTSVLWRVGLCSVVYMVLFVVIGHLTFEVAAGPYYETMEGLAVPTLSVIVPLQLLRGILIVGSVFPLLMGLRTSIRRQFLVIGGCLYVFSGLAPLLLQAHALPPTLLGIHAVELLLMLGPTGLVIVSFLRPQRTFDGFAQTGSPGMHG